MLILNLTGYWFDKTESGEKDTDYRVVKPYWTKRLYNATKHISLCEKFFREDVLMLQDFYSKGIRPVSASIAGLKIPVLDVRGYNYKRTLEKEICKIEVISGKDTDLHIDKLVYALHYAKEAGEEGGGIIIMVYGYLRVSTDKQDGEAQKIGIEELAKRRGFIVDKYIDDEGVSGTKEPYKRQLGKLLEDLQEGDVIIASEISRLGRDLFMIMRILEICMKKNVKVITVKDHYELGDNITSKVLAFAFGLSAEIERKMISERTKEGLARRRALGVKLGRKLGSKNKTNKFKKNKTKIRAMLSQGFSKSEIARQCGMDRTTLYRYIVGHR